MKALTYDEAAHLLRRMGFGGPPDEINDLVSRGCEAAVDSLLNYEAVDSSALDQSQRRDKSYYEKLDDPDYPFEIRTRVWWLYRMVATRRPFEEKMTLFWHNHFATSISKAPPLLMLLQNRTFRQNALARFDTLLLKVAQDPAMLIWPRRGWPRTCSSCNGLSLGEGPTRTLRAGQTMEQPGTGLS